MNEKTKKALAEALMPIPKEIPYVNSGGCGVFARDEQSLKCNARNNYGTDRTRTVRKDRFARLVADKCKWNPRFNRDIYGERLARLIEEAVTKIVGPANTHARDLI